MDVKQGCGNQCEEHRRYRRINAESLHAQSFCCRATGQVNVRALHTLHNEWKNGTQKAYNCHKKHKNELRLVLFESVLCFLWSVPASG
jgi:hypothetical protein